MSLGQKIRQLRISRNYTIEDISEYLGYKNKKSIWEIETGKVKDVGFEKIVKLSKLYNVPETFFKDESNNDMEYYIPEKSPFDDMPSVEKIVFLKEENHKLWRENGLLKAKLLLQESKLKKIT